MKLMVALFRCRAVEAVPPAFVGSLIQRFRHEVPEGPEEACGGKTREDHHQEFVSEGAGHTDG